eukprot:CAMPEP_0198284908 /NCGR_PEP_ID=MMETSP1449-20131203/4279_1 /TAXON_ID=420275 /ORGANISM="Attheya septentrionalis, Strain CCMP2084" /LENGTH=950 /DNA_ID=CAMNT_0043982129 /DNA_START=181 /DNA_END=3033 /DNA_ORIENTATION=+
MPTILQKRQLQRGRAPSNRRKAVNNPMDEDSLESSSNAEIQDTKEENLDLDDSEQDEEEEEQDTKEEDSESYKDEDEDEDDEEEEEEIPVPQRLSPRRRPTVDSSSSTSRTARPVRITRSKRGRDSSADTRKKEEDESSGDDEEDSHPRKQSKPARKRSSVSGRRKVRSAPKRRTENRKKDISSSSDHEDGSRSKFQDEESVVSDTNELDSDFDVDDEEEPVKWNRSKKGRQKKETNSSLRRSSRRTSRNKEATHAHDQDDESDDTAQRGDDISHARITPKRSCTKQTNEKIASVVALIEKSKSEMDSEDSDGVPNHDTKFSRTLSFSPDSNNDRKEARSNRSSKRKESEKKETKQSKKRKRYGVKTSDDDDEEYVENEESGSESEVSLDSEDDELIEDAATNENGNVDMDNIYDTDSTGNSVNFKKRDRMASPVLKIKHFNKKKSPQHFNDDDSESDASVNDFKTTPSQTPPSIPFCPSTEDRITAEELPEKHICYNSPDGTNRHCFNLSTLRKIALSASIKQYGDDGKLVFLQPPHFRSAMEDDLLDQIASRFGRGALDLNGDYYNKSYTTWGDATGTCTTSEQSFDDQVHRYVQGIMGQTDLYCCPVCYCEAEAQATGATKDFCDDDDSVIEDIESKTNHFASKVDPMAVLGFPDNDEFRVASTFCFRNMATVKQHLRHVHAVNTSGLDGNNLYNRFKIRAPDGLLQQHTHTMSSYWRSGNNHSFVYLLALVDERTHHNLERETEEDNNMDAIIGYESVEEFSRSFPNRAQKLWNAVSAPYTSGYQDDEIGDFIVDGDVESEEEEEHVPPPMIHNPEESHLSPEEEIASKLREIRKRKRIGELSSESDSEHEEEDVSEDELEVLKPRVYQSDIVDTDSGEDDLDASDQSEDDDWMRNKRKKSKTFLNKKKRAISKRKNRIEAPVTLPISTSPSPRKKQFRIQESDED